MFDDLLVELDNLKKVFPNYCYSTIKRQKNDLIGNFYDYDLRIIIDTESEDEIFKLNEIILKVFNKLYKKDTINARLFEHTPGFIITLNELKLGLGNIIDIKTQTFIHGDINKFDLIKNLYSKMKYNAFCDEYNINLFKGRLNKYNLDEEPIYEFYNTNKYKKYCLVWHYYAVALFGAAGFISKSFFLGKNDALSFFDKLNLNLLYNDKNKLSGMIENERYTVNDVKIFLERDLMKIDKYILQKECEFASQTTNINEGDLIVKGAIALSIMRTKLSRYKYYKKHIRNDYTLMDLLIKREKRELLSILLCFKNLYFSFNTGDKLYKVIYKNIAKLEELNNNEINIINLNKYIHFFNMTIIDFEKYFKTILDKAFGNQIIDTIKIKIISKCTRTCSFCIFSDNTKQELSLIDFNKIIDKISNISFNKIFINGGEPTLHSEFEHFSKIIYDKFKHKEKIIGTNCTILSKSKKILDISLKYYDSFLIGCDDEHKNYDDIKTVIPILKKHKKFILVNTLRDYISEDNKRRLDEFCKKQKVIHLYNDIHHIDLQTTKHNISKICRNNKNKHLMILENGDCFKCFNGVNLKNPDLNIADKDYIEKIFKDRVAHYDFCYYCNEYKT